MVCQVDVEGGTNLFEWGQQVNSFHLGNVENASCIFYNWKAFRRPLLWIWTLKIIESPYWTILYH